LEAMADGGVMMGLPRAEALELASQSKLGVQSFNRLFFNYTTALQGAARMVLQTGTHPAQLKDSVTSWCHLWSAVAPTDIFLAAPGGCTIAGLLALEDGRVRSTIARGIQIATERASALGQPERK
jgi:pyrroline-5-carboxylate reductase